MGICASLFSASITLAGFIAVFLVFRYRTIDNYVDNGKARIRSILEEQIRNDPSIDIRIQDIGKERPEADDVRCFHDLINEVFINKDLANKTKSAVEKFVKNIHYYRGLRDLIVRLGLASITLWVVLSLFNLIGYSISPCPFSGISYSETVTGISIRFFIISMVLTLCFVFYSLLAKRPK